MNRLEAIQAVIAAVDESDILIHANGAISRESFYCKDRGANFYLLGSMGLAASVGLGIAVCRPDRRVLVLDGDGNALMGLGNLALIGGLTVKNLLHIVLDNGVYGTTGNQPTIADRISFVGIALACGYVNAETISTQDAVQKNVNLHRPGRGPRLIHIPVSTDVPIAAPRIPYSAQEMKERFRSSCT